MCECKNSFSVVPYKVNEQHCSFRCVLQPNFNVHFSACSVITKIVIIAVITTIGSTSLITTTCIIITGPSVVALPTVPVCVTHARIIATTIEVIAVDVDAGGFGVGRGVVKVALAVGIVLARAAAGWSKVAVVIRVLVAVHLLTEGITGIRGTGPAQI